VTNMSFDNSTSKRLSAMELIRILNLKPLPSEDGKYRQTYASADLTDGVPRNTAIYYMLEGDDFSHLHRLPRNELYHFYLGDPVELTELLPDGSVLRTVLGQDLAAGQTVQHMVNAGNWQGSRLIEGGEYALLGTTMSPGFTEDCYEHGARDVLLLQYPEAANEIIRLTHHRSM